MVNAVREAVDLLAAQKMVPLTPLRGLLARLDGGRLPGQPGGGRPQGRALHDARSRSSPRSSRGAAARSPRRSLLWLAAAPAWGGGPLSVVTTSTDLKALVEAVGGDRVRVESLAPPLHDPHAVEVKPGAARAAQARRAPGAHRPRPRAVACARRCRTVGEPRLAAGRRRATSTSRAASSCCRPRRRACAPSAARTCTASATRTTGSTPRTRGRSPRRILERARAALARRRARCFEANRAPLPRAARRGPGALARGAGAVPRHASRGRARELALLRAALRPRRRRRRSSRRRACRPRRPYLAALTGA